MILAVNYQIIFPIIIMVNRCETKNLVIIYQKLFNFALKRHKTRVSSNKFAKNKFNIRSCSSVESFKRLMIEHPQLKKIMEQMFDSGELLKNLTNWKGQYSNMAIALKYFNRLENLVRNPELQSNSWMQNCQPLPKRKFNIKRQKSTSEQGLKIEDNMRLVQIKQKTNQGIIISQPRQLKVSESDMMTEPSFEYQTSFPYNYWMGFGNKNGFVGEYGDLLAMYKLAVDQQLREQLYRRSFMGW